LQVPLAVAGLTVLLTACGATPPPRQPPPPPPAAPAETELERRPIPPSGVHVVAAGETLSEIAYVYHLDTHALARANAIADPDHISEGRRLVLRWPEPPPLAGPPARAATARAETAAPDADATPQDAPLRVVVTPREGVAAEARRAPREGADETTAAAARPGLDTAAVAPPQAARAHAAGERVAAPEE
jgi:LysM repeat protein